MSRFVVNDGRWCEVCLNKVFRRKGRWVNLRVRRRPVVGSVLFPGALERARVCRGCLERFGRFGARVG